MKISLLLPFLLLPFLTIAQVGIGTTDPQETLHVNGTMRVSNTSSSVTSTKVSGLDANGTMRQVSVGSNLVLSNNVLSVQVKYDHSFGAVSLTTKTHNNIDLLIGPGQTNDGKTIIRIYNTSGDTEFTGVKAGYDGQSIWVYPQDSKFAFKTNDNSSLLANRIEDNVKKSGERYCMINIVYDGTRQKWIIMQHHGG